MAATTIVWKETVTEGEKDTPRKTADLYAKDAVLWGTVSEEVRETPEQIYDYFVSLSTGKLGIAPVCQPEIYLCMSRRCVGRRRPFFSFSQLLPHT